MQEDAYKSITQRDRRGGSRHLGSQSVQAVTSLRWSAGPGATSYSSQTRKATENARTATDRPAQAPTPACAAAQPPPPPRASTPSRRPFRGALSAALAAARCKGEASSSLRPILSLIVISAVHWLCAITSVVPVRQGNSAALCCGN